MTNEASFQEKKIPIFGASDCYGLTRSLSFTIRASCEMADTVDGDILRRAVGMLEKRFPFSRCPCTKGSRASAT